MSLNEQEQPLLAPNGRPSKLPPLQYKLVRTPEFKNWFGDWETDPENSSKVVDENGEPLLLYHGSPNKFDVFDRKESRGGILELGHFFSTNINLAKLYGENIIPVFLNLRTIKRFDASAYQNVEAWDHLAVDAGYKIAYNRQAMDFLMNGKFGVPKVDGVAAHNVIDMFSGYINNDYIPNDVVQKFIGTSYLVFDGGERNIKIADGSNTTFNPNNPNIKSE
jgi:hypothetical protein